MQRIGPDSPIAHTPNEKVLTLLHLLIGAGALGEAALYSR